MDGLKMVEKINNEGKNYVSARFALNYCPWVELSETSIRNSVLLRDMSKPRLRREWGLTIIDAMDVLLPQGIHLRFNGAAASQPAPTRSSQRGSPGCLRLVEAACCPETKPEKSHRGP